MDCWEKFARNDNSAGMRLFSWNVNGIRACELKGFSKWFSEHGADIVSLQETKITDDKLDLFLRNPSNYHSIWNFSVRPGYSGTAIFSKKEPESVELGIGDEELDAEGRVITAEFRDFFLVNAYFPNSGREHLRLPHKLRFCKKMFAHLKALEKKGKGVILCGDYNIAHKEIDLKNPKTNHETAGFLPEERAWMGEFLEGGYTDVFRKFEPGPDHYTWWSYRPGVRKRNIGWRIDYHCVNNDFVDRVVGVGHQPQVLGSDHCPVFLDLKS